MHRLEHVNLNVGDAARVTPFLLAAFPDFRIRGGGVDTEGRPWCHVGDDDSYFALTSVGSGRARTADDATAGLNHVGIEVDDVDAVRARLIAAGFVPYSTLDDHPARRRMYCFDAEGTDWEFVEYRTSDRSRRNDYEHA